MKLLRVGDLGNEIPAALDNNGDIRDLSSHIKDLTPETINFKNLEKLKKLNLEALPLIPKSSRITLSILLAPISIPICIKLNKFLFFFKLV